MKLPVAGLGVPWLYARCPGIVIPNELGSFYIFGQQGIPDGRRRPGEYDPRDAKWAASPLAPLVDLSLVRVRQRPKSLEASAQMLQFAALTNAPHARLPVDGDDGL